MTKKSKEFFLFRVDVTTPTQKDIFKNYENVNRVSLLLNATLDAKEISLRNRKWSVGNLSFSNGDISGYFCFGRASAFNKPSRDNEGGDYDIYRDIKYPFSRIVFDYSNGIVAIEKNYDLSSDVEHVAKVLQKLLSSTDVFVRSGLILSIRPIRDSKLLVEKIKAAFYVKKFTIKFTRKNPRNLNKRFHHYPKLQLESIGGEEGELTFKNGNMDKELLADITESARRASNDIVVSYSDRPRSKFKTEKLSEEPISKINLPEEFSADEAVFLLNKEYGVE